MPTYDITSPDGKTYEVTAPDGATQEQVMQYVQQQHAPPAATPAPQAKGPPPTLLQTLGASPLGRFAHDAILEPITGMAGLLAKADPTGGMVAPMNAKAENTYQGALAAQRNRPGYAEARAQADALAQKRGAGGITDQMIAPFTSAAAGIAGLPGGLNSSNAAADAQTAAQQGYQQANPKSAFLAQMGGGLLMAPKLNAPAALPASGAPSIADLKAAAKASYQSVDNSGVRVSTDALNRLGDSVQDSFASRLDPVLHPDATAAFNRLTQFATDGAKGGHIATFQDLDNLRRVVADAAQSTKPADKAMAKMMMNRVDDFVEGLKPADLDTSLQDQLRSELQSATSAKGQIAKQIKSIEANKPGALAARGAAGADTRDLYMKLHDQLPQAEAGRQGALDAFKSESDLINAGPQATIDALGHARDMWSRASQAELIQRQIDKATIKASANYSQSGIENALRQQFKSLALNDKAMARLRPEVQQAVKDVATGSPVGNVLRAVGKYAPHGPVATMAGMGVGSLLGGVGGAAEGGLASLAIPAVGEAARTGATKITQAAAQRAMDTAALGKGQTIAHQPLFHRPALPGRNLTPLGLSLPLLLQTQNQ